MARFCFMFLIFLAQGCAHNEYESNINWHSFNGVKFALPDNFVVFEKGNERIKEQQGDFTSLYVERTRVDEEPKTGIAVILSKIPEEHLLNAGCDYSAISKIVETREVVPSVKEVYSQTKSFSVDRMSPSAFRLYIETEDANKIEHQVLVGGGMTVNIMINYEQGSNYHPESGLGDSIYKSIVYIDSSVCDDEIANRKI